MLPIVAALTLLAVVPAVYAQEAEQQEPPVPVEAPVATQPAREAISRGSRPQESNPRVGTAERRVFGVTLPRRAAVAPATDPPAGAAMAAAAQESQPEQERRAVPRGSRPQDDNPRTGTAIPRSPLPPPASPPRGRITTDRRGAATPNRGRTTVVRPPTVRNYYYYPYSDPYSSRYYYPRQYYPYGYGAFGLGYFYYDPYRWAPGYTTGYFDNYYRRPFSTFDIGELRLDVSPRHAQVLVDGYYAGQVDDFDGAFQAIKLEAGTYRIEITAPGYETLAFDVRITPGQKIRYQGELRRLP